LAAADLAFIDVSVIPMTAYTVLEHQTVVIKDGLIAAIGNTSDIAIPANATVVQGQGRYLIPGLADMHVHFYEEWSARLFVAYGVTRVRSMWGFPFHLQWKSRIEEGELLGPRFTTGGTIVDGAPRLLPSTVEVDDIESAIREMDRQKSAGYDFFKIYSNLRLDVFDAVAAHSKEIDFPFAGHVPGDVPLEHAMRSGMQTIEHLTGWEKTIVRKDGFIRQANEQRGSNAGDLSLFVVEALENGETTVDELFDPQQRIAMANLARQTGIWNVPTLIARKRLMSTSREAAGLLRRPENRLVSPQIVEGWKQENDPRRAGFSDEYIEVVQRFFPERLRMTRALHDAGARILAGTDAPNPYVIPGYSVHEELALFVEAGLSPYDALYAATRAPSEFLQDDSFGTVEVGKRADLVLLNDNPLEDILATRAIAGVSIGNRWLDRPALDELLDSIAQRFDDEE
jgi:hypothetical protein